MTDGRRAQRGFLTRLLIAAVLAPLLTAAGGAQSPDAASAVDLQGKLYRSVFVAGAGVLSAADLPALAEPLRSRLANYLSRRAAFKSHYRSAPDDLTKVRSDAKRRLLERSLVALVDVPGIERTAADFVSAAPIAHEWGGLAQGPLEEAAYAENVLKKDPGSPLAPWLYVFIAQRQRIAFEAYENEKNPDGMRTTAKKYRALVERARGAADPIYAAITDDMERQPYLYLKGSQHPRDYNPDT